jgi:hypothetical protein
MDTQSTPLADMLKLSSEVMPLQSITRDRRSGRYYAVLLKAGVYVVISGIPVTRNWRLVGLTELELEFVTTRNRAMFTKWVSLIDPTGQYEYVDAGYFACYKTRVLQPLNREDFIFVIDDDANLRVRRLHTWWTSEFLLQWQFYKTIFKHALRRSA